MRPSSLVSGGSALASRGGSKLGSVEVPAIAGLRLCSKDPEEDARLKAEYCAENQRVARLLEEKGFDLTGDEPGGVQINRFLHLGKLDE